MTVAWSGTPASAGRHHLPSFPGIRPVPSTRQTVRFKMFRGTMATWDQLFAEAAEFATRLGRERLITISHSEDQQDGVVAVWYWADADAAAG